MSLPKESVRRFNSQKVRGNFALLELETGSRRFHVQDCSALTFDQTLRD